MQADGILVRFPDDGGELLVQREDIQQRVTLPWKPRDLSDYFVIFRRKHNRHDEYVGDLRVRRQFIKRILTLLTAKGNYRPHQGEATRHYYYSACDIMSDAEIDAVFPEDDYVPPDLNFQDNDDLLPQRSINQSTFVNWMTEGQHDCDVARSLGVAWTRTLHTSRDETLGDFLCVTS